MASMSSAATVVIEQVSFSHMLEKEFDIVSDEHFNNNTLLKHYTNVKDVNRIPVNNELLAAVALAKENAELLQQEFDMAVAATADPFDEACFGEGPVMVLDTGDVLAKAEKWVRLMPRVQPFFAVKCNPNETVINILAHAMQLMSPEVAARAHYTNFGYDCASKDEMELVTGFGISTERIIFAHPCKMASHLKYARDRGVELMTFDGLPELHKIKRLYPSAKLVLRLRVNDKGAQCPLGLKFGCERNQIAPLLATAMQLGLDVVGISFHVGSGCRDPTAFSDAIELARQAFNIGKTVGYSFTMLDIGGGFPGHKGASIQIEPIAEVVNKAIEQYFPYELYSHVRIIAEPGRYFVASAFTLFVEIIAKKLPQETVCDEIMYYVNDGVYGSFNCCMFDHATVEVTVPDIRSGSSQDSGGLKSVDSAIDLQHDSSVDGGKRCSIWGPTCDSLDKILENVALPELEIGDWLIFEDMGAYTIAAGSTFNGFPRPVLKPVCKQSTWQKIAPRLQMHNSIQQQQRAVADSLGADGNVLISFVCGANGDADNNKCATTTITDAMGVLAFDDVASVVSDDFSAFGAAASMVDSAIYAGSVTTDSDAESLKEADTNNNASFFDDNAYIYV